MWQGVPIPPIPKSRKPRAVSGFEVYLGSTEAPECPVVLCPDGKHRGDVARWRKLCREAWETLSAQEQAIYNAGAENRNRARAQEAEDSQTADEDKGSEEAGDRPQAP